MRQIEDEDDVSINRLGTTKLSIDTHHPGEIVTDRMMVLPPSNGLPTNQTAGVTAQVPIGNDRIVRSKMTMRRTKRSPNERRFKCDQCDRMFFTRKDVKRHNVVHTGVRNYACPFCQQRFGRKDHLVRHAKKSHQKDTRTSAGSNLNNPAPGTSPLARRISFPHSPHSLTSTPSSLTNSGRMIVGSNTINSINLNTSNHLTDNHHPSHSSCSYSSNIPMDNMILLNSSSPNIPTGCNNSVSNSTNHHHHHDICYSGNVSQTHNNPMNLPISTDGHGAFGSNGPMSHHTSVSHPPPSLCENSLFNNGGHYFSLGAGPSPFMNSAYISNCFGHLTVNPGNGNGQGLSVPICSDQTSPVNYANAMTHYSVDVSLRDHLPHFNQVFQ
ncbi:uncharacterized protein LOC141851106 [Brevipalpus obovatus]|uniref:uncharacterized protein LOC141851106 n=1 Tax=Brevipalpus obovatus TaxID=246614 RepID=UPI003D9EC361